jgi:serine/threonine protein phosphatase 1
MKTDKRSGKSLFRVISDRPRRLFAVGDIHGNINEIRALIDFLKKERGLDDRDCLVFIGDYIDRGPASRQVIDLMLSLKAGLPDTVFLKGNHEDMLLGFLGQGGSGGDVYLSNGGAAFFDSYGIAPFESLSEILLDFPPSHLDFIKGLELGVVIGNFIFVHAGIDPEQALEEQVPEDLLWIRKPFINSGHALGKTVVFGHTAFDQVLLDLPFKIGIDTGIAYGNRLSAVELIEGELYQVEMGETTVKASHLNDLLDRRT